MVEVEKESSKNNPNGVYFNLPNHGKTLVQVLLAAPLGSNFMSGVYTLKAITEIGNEYTAFAKVVRTDPRTQQSTYIARSYHREIGTYQELFPIFCQIREENGLTAKDIPINTPEVYYTNLVECTEESRYSSDTTVVMEELKSQGFQMLDPTIGCDFDHGKLAVETYAYYHSLSIAFYRKWKKSDGRHNFPSTFRLFDESPFFVNPADFFDMGILQAYSAVLEMSNKKNEAKWLEEFKPRLQELWDFEASKKAGPLTCILHGDSWNNNILYQYHNKDKSKPTKMYLVDWQIARTGHPCMDVCYYLFTSTTSEMRQKHFKSLLLHYFSTLKSSLAKLGIDLDNEGYSQQRFLQETKERLHSIMLMALFMLPVLFETSVMAEFVKKDMEQTTTSDGSQYEGLEKELQKMMALFSPESILQNQFLCDRIVGLVVDVKKMALLD